MTKPSVFCAIDVNDLSRAEDLVHRLSPLPLHFKIGLEFFIAEGPTGVEKLRGLMRDDTKIFLDLKLHDIPNTVAGAVKSATKCGADYLTIHAAGGKEMMQAAAEAASDSDIKLLGVTVLTHLEGPGTKEEVLRLAGGAAAAGLSGAICSPHEICVLKEERGNDFILMVPGIRPAGSAKGDQKRTMTPAEAAAAGADHLVIGRPITQAADPVAAAREILDTLSS